MTTKQYYIKDKKYEWTEATWKAVRDNIQKPFDGNVQYASIYKTGGSVYYANILDPICDWGWDDADEYWQFQVLEDNVEVPEELVPFYGEKEEMQKEISDSGLMDMLKALDNYALEVDPYELGLPTWNCDPMLQIVKEHLALEKQLDKQIKAIRAVDSSITQEQAKNLIKAGVVK